MSAGAIKCVKLWQCELTIDWKITDVFGSEMGRGCYRMGSVQEVQEMGSYLTTLFQ
jgi:hypothetical protein